MAYRIDANNFSRINRAGNQSSSVPENRQQVFQQSLQDAEAARSRTGGPTIFDPHNERAVVVEAGDSAALIAQEFDVELDDLIAANPGILDDPDSLDADNVVFLPPQDPALVADGERNPDNAPEGEEAFRSWIYERANTLQYDDQASPEDRDELISELARDVRDYLNALPASERELAAERLLGDERDWQDGTAGREAILVGQEDSFAGNIYREGNRIEYAEAGEMDHGTEISALADQVRERVSVLPPDERGEALQRLYDRDWRDAGPAKLAIERTAEGLDFSLRATSHAGPEVERRVRDVIDEARTAGSPEEIERAYDSLYAEQSDEVQQALDRNAEARQLLSDSDAAIANSAEQVLINELMEGWAPHGHISDELIDALRGDHPDIGTPSEAGHEYIVDQVVELIADSDQQSQNPMVATLVDFAYGEADPTTRNVIASRLAHNAVEVLALQEQDIPAGDPTYLASAAMRAATGGLNDEAQLEPDDIASVQDLIDGLDPEEMATFVSLLDRESHRRVLTAIADMPPGETVSAGVQTLFAGADKGLSPESLDLLADVIAREWHPDDPALQEQEANRLAGILETDQGKTLLLRNLHYTGQDNLSLETRVEALALIRADTGIDAETLEQTRDPWQNPAFTNPVAQEAAAPYLNLRGDAPIIYSGTDLENTIGTAMGMAPELPEDLSDDEIQELVAAGELSLFQGEESEHIQDIADNIRDLGGDDPAVTILPILYSSGQSGPVSLPLFRVETSEGPKFVDNIGRQYDSFESWKDNNKLPPGSMTYPTDGELTMAADGSVELSGPEATPETPNSLGDHLVGMLDTAALVGGIVAGGMLIIGTGGIAAPIVGGAAAGWMALRAGDQLLDRYQHGQSINPISDSEARMLWLEGVSGATGVGAFASAGRLASLSRSGAPLSQTAARITGTTLAASNTADTAAIVNLAHYTATNWEQMSGQERMTSILSMGFWGTMVGMNVSHGPSLSARTLPDMFNPFAQIRNIETAYSPRVVNDPDLPGNEIRIAEDPSSPGGFVIQKGPTASDADVTNHVRLARLMYQNNGLSGQVRNFFGEDVVQPGSRAYQFKFETEKLTPKLEQLSADLQNANLTPSQRAQIQAEIEDYSSFLSDLRIAADNPNIDLDFIRQPATGREIAQTDGPNGTRHGSSQEALETYAQAHGLDAADYVWYRQTGTGDGNTAALRRADSQSDAPELEIVTNQNGDRVVQPKPANDNSSEPIHSRPLEDVINTYGASGNVSRTIPADIPPLEAPSATSPRRVEFGDLRAVAGPNGQTQYQATGVEATITPDMIRTGTSADGRIPDLAGWQGGRHGHSRGHLLARVLGGSGSDRRNLVTLHQNPTNSPVMSDFEMIVANAVQSGEIVNYRVTPRYDGAGMPTEVVLQAKGSNGLDIEVTINNVASE